jgi:hypothetical protein
MKKKYKILIGITLLIIAFRIMLPYAVLFYANKTLANMNGYYGHIEDIDLALFRGAYRINSMFLNKVDSVTNKQTKFFKSENIDLSLEWSAIFKGAIVGELTFESPELIFTKDKTELADVKKDSTDFRKLLTAFMPVKVNRFEVNNGTIHYVDINSKPKLDLVLTKAHIIALNLTNLINNKVELPSTVNAEATLYEGSLILNMRLDALAANTKFDLNAELKDTKLILLNDFFLTYGNFDVSQGTFGLYTEMATKDGEFKGYVKPIIKNLKVLGPEDRNDTFLHKIWESIVGAAGVIFRNQIENQIATKITITGTLKNPKTKTLEAIWEVLRNAFIQALMPSVDNEINISSVNQKKPGDKKNIMQKIFSKDEEKDGKKK